MIMNENVLVMIEQSRALNPKLFSLIKIILMSNLVVLGKDGSTYRELKAALMIGDGALHSNLKALMDMGYIESREVEIEEKKLTSYNVTEEGEIAWNNAKKWLHMVLDCGVD